MTTQEETFRKLKLSSHDVRIDDLERRNDAHVRAINSALGCIYHLAHKAGDADLKAEVKIITKTLRMELGDI